MFFTMARLPIVQFISSPVPSRSKFVFRQPKLSYENNLFLLPFRNSVWYSIGAVLFFLFLALFGVAFWEWKRNDHNIDSVCIFYILYSTFFIWFIFIKIVLENKWCGNLTSKDIGYCNINFWSNMSTG